MAFRLPFGSNRLSGMGDGLRGALSPEPADVNAYSARQRYVPGSLFRSLVEGAASGMDAGMNAGALGGNGTLPAFAGAIGGLRAGFQQRDASELARQNEAERAMMEKMASDYDPELPKVPVSILKALQPFYGSQMKQQTALMGKTGGFADSSIEDMANAMIRGDLAPSNLPGFGQNSLKSKVLAKVFEMDPRFDIAGSELGYQKRLATSRYEGGSAVQTPVRMIASVIPNLQMMQDYSDKLAKTGVRFVNKATLAAASQAGDSDAAGFQVASQLVGDEIAKVLAGGGTGNATSDAKLKQGIAILDAGYSPEQMRQVIHDVQLILLRRAAALQNSPQQYGGHEPVAPQTQATMTATAPNGHKIVSMDGGATWRDAVSGQPVQ